MGLDVYVHEYLEIPDDIKTQDELDEFCRKHDGGWCFYSENHKNLPKKYVRKIPIELIDWFLHEFDVKRLSGEGYAFVEPKIEKGHAEMQVETYDYEKGYNMFGSAVFNCINPNYVTRAGVYGEICVCQLVGDALSDMARFTTASDTVHILARPPKD